MSDTVQPHNHADYEQTFTRIGTILDVIAQEQLTHARSMTGLTELVARVMDGQSKLTAIVERIAEREEKLIVIIEGIAEGQDKLDEAMGSLAIKGAASEDNFNAAMERLAMKSAESEDNLNALIELMDRHLREGDKQ
jgi:GTPase Era involved in 16S rRNA processing